MKNLLVVLFILLFSTLMFSQERMILRANGEQIKIDNKKDLREAITGSKIRRSDGKIFKSEFINSSKNISGVFDTVSYRNFGGVYNTNFGFFGQDAMLMWFEAPTDMIIEGIGFQCSDDTGAENATVSFRLLRLNWTKQQLENFSSAAQIGYYPSIDDGFNQVDKFGEEATGNWISLNENNILPPWTNHENPDSNTFNYDLWSNGGTVSPINSPFGPIYQWVEIENSHNMPTVERGEIFAVVVNHDGTVLDEDRIAFWSDNAIGYPGWKFYENGRYESTAEGQGWWVRMYTWDFAVAVEMTSPPPPRISNITDLRTTLSTEPRTVEATISGTYPGIEESISEVNMIYNINGGNEIYVPMTDNGVVYSAQIPGQTPGTEVKYWITVTDTTGYISTSYLKYSYSIYKVIDDRNLVVFNGYDSPIGYPQQYYWGPDTSYSAEWTYDAWGYGPLTKELVDNYSSIFEICTNGPTNYNREVISEWLNADASHNYLLAGQEWLGADKQYTDQDYAEGTFEYDILGITHSYNDISYDGTSGQELPTKVMPQEGTLIGGAMFYKVAEINAVDTSSIDSVPYDVGSEIGGGLSNWIDGFEVLENTEVFMKAETRGIAGVPAVQEVNVGVSNQLASGNKIVFMSYDPISINSTPTSYWLGRGNQSNIYQTMLWFDTMIIGLDENSIAPEVYTLSQNYPNPFNPCTTIKYSIPSIVGNRHAHSTTNVELSIYDILGREVATLVNKQQKAGSYKVNFNASTSSATNLSSGVYFYRLQSGSFVESRKMILLK